MNLETLIKLFQGTNSDFAIACSWLVEHTDPIKYIEEHGNVDSISPNCTKSLSWSKGWRGEFSIGSCLYYKYAERKYIVKCLSGITVTDRNYDGGAEVIIH